MTEIRIGAFGWLLIAEMVLDWGFSTTIHNIQELNLRKYLFLLAV